MSRAKPPFRIRTTITETVLIERGSERRSWTRRSHGAPLTVYSDDYAAARRAGERAIAQQLATRKGRKP